MNCICYVVTYLTIPLIFQLSRISVGLRLSTKNSGCHVVTSMWGTVMIVFMRLRLLFDCIFTFSLSF